jgi:sodium/bile acid cotransporter 7
MINLALCIAFTGFSFMLCRPPKSLVHPVISPRISKLETISICFCAPAKTQALGIPLIAAMYASSTDMTRALIQVPMILYTAEQILVGQVLVVLFKRWLAKGKEASLEQGPEPEKDSIGA